ncbi:MAG: hypothetical protein ACRC8P_03840 [Spiroplasma sp.]
MTEIEQMLEMNYEEVCNYLKNKYGNVTKDYFTDETCKTKTKGIGRGNDGLYIHHIDEDKAILLSTPEYAKLKPFAYQKADRLVYCNLLEHLVLHIKIFEYNPNMRGIVGGIDTFIVPELNDIYSGIQYKIPWKQKVIEVVLPLKEDYFKCLKKLVEFGFSYQLLQSFNAKYNIWSEKNNQKLYKKIIKLGVRF